MADNDYTAIKPIQALQNVGQLTPVEQRKERKRRRPSREDQEQQQPTDEATGETESQASADGPDQDRSIDFCA